MFPHRRILTFSTQHTNACVHPRSLALLQYMRTIQYAIHAIHPRLLALLQYIRTHPRQNCCCKIWSLPMQLKQGVKSLDVVTDSHGSFACAGKIQTHCCGNVKSIMRRQSVRCACSIRLCILSYSLNIETHQYMYIGCFTHIGSGQQCQVLRR